MRHRAWAIAAVVVLWAPALVVAEGAPPPAAPPPAPATSAWVGLDAVGPALAAALAPLGVSPSWSLGGSDDPGGAGGAEEYMDGDLRNVVSSTTLYGDVHWYSDVVLTTSVNVRGNLTIHGVLVEHVVTAERQPSLSVSDTGNLTVLPGTRFRAVGEEGVSATIGIRGHAHIDGAELDRVVITVSNTTDLRHHEDDRVVIENSRIHGSKGTGISVSAWNVTVRQNQLYKLGTGVAVSASCSGTCPEGQQVRPIIEKNLFEMNGVAATFGNYTRPLFRNNWLETNIKGVVCSGGANATLEKNNFILHFFAAYAGTSGANFGVASVPPSRCQRDQNFFNTIWGDAEIEAPGAEDPAPTRVAPRAWTLTELGMPPETRPLFPAHIEYNTTTWDASRPPVTGRPIVVTGADSPRLTIRGISLDLGGGMLGTRNHGRLTLDADGATGVSITGGRLLLGAQGCVTNDDCDRIQHLTMAEDVGPGAAILAYETKSIIRDSAISNQKGNAIETAFGDLSNAKNNLELIERVTLRDNANGVVGFGNPTVRQSTFLNTGIGVTLALSTAALVESSEFVTVAGVVGILLPGTVVVRNAVVTGNAIGILSAIGTIQVESSNVLYNVAGAYALGGTIQSLATAPSNVYHNTLAGLYADALVLNGASIAGSVTMNGCGKDDNVFKFQGSQATWTTTSTGCPPPPSALRFVPHVAGEGGHPTTLVVPSGPLDGPYVAPRGTRLVVANATIDGACASPACPAGVEFWLGAKMGGGIDIENATLSNLSLQLEGRPARMFRSSCSFCVVNAIDPPGMKDQADRALPDNPGPTLSWNRFVRSSITLSHQNALTSFDHASFERTSLTVSDRSHLVVTDSVLVNSSSIRRADLKPNAEPYNHRSDVSVRWSNFARSGGVLSDSDDSLPTAPATAIDARHNWWGHECGPGRSGCIGDRASASVSGALAPPAPLLAPHATAPIPIAPFASAHWAPASSTTLTPVAFSSLAFSWPHVPIASLAWDLGDGTITTDPAPTHRYASPGIYTVTLRVEDAHRGVALVSRPLVIENLAPTADFVASTLSPLEGEPVWFEASGSDPEGTPVSFEWRWSDGQTASGPSASRSFFSFGSVVANLTVTDADGGKAYRERAITVRSASNRDPASAFSWCCFQDHGTDLAFHDVSSDPDGRIVSWRWDWGDGEVSTTRHATHAYDEPGQYTACLTVTDDGGASNVSCQHVFVDDTTRHEAVVVAGTLTQANRFEGRVTFWNGSPVPFANVLFETWLANATHVDVEWRDECVPWAKSVCYSKPGPTTRDRPEPYHGFSAKADEEGRFSVAFHDLRAGAANAPGVHQWRSRAWTSEGLYGNHEISWAAGSYVVLGP